MSVIGTEPNAAPDAMTLDKVRTRLNYELARFAEKNAAVIDQVAAAQWVKLRRSSAI